MRINDPKLPVAAINFTTQLLIVVGGVNGSRWTDTVELASVCKS